MQVVSRSEVDKTPKDVKIKALEFNYSIGKSECKDDASEKRTTLDL